MYGQLVLFAILLSSSAKCEVDNRKLSSVLGELLDLRTELNDLFQSPRKRFADEEPKAEWVVHVNRGVAEAQWIANLTNTKFIGAVRGFPDLYVFRSYLPQNQSENHRIKRDLEYHQRKERIYWSELQEEQHRTKREVVEFNDPLWKSQWQVNGHNGHGSMRIPNVWAEGYTGRGVIVSILDDGIDWSHKDLAQNYDPLASFDLNGNDEDPMPTLDEFNKHGTRCAGEVAMVANNSFCGIGVAYNSKIGGIRMLDGRVTDRVEGEALGILVEHVDILSASWGPTDNGMTVEKPGKLAQMSIEKGIKEGRKGKGTIYVWASGNGGHVDDCSCDGYASSIYTFTVSSSSELGTFPWYGEHCTSTLTSAFSSGTRDEKKITTIDPQNLCTSNHTGTSASAPIAAGIVALALEANPGLTWRDVQHLAVWTSNPVSQFDNSGWQINGAGLWSSPKFGFGLIDALRMVTLAKDFESVDPQQICTASFPNFKTTEIRGDTGLVFSFKLNGCKGWANEIGSLEHVQLVGDMDSNARGSLSIWIESPSGMRSQLLHPRPKDNSTEGFEQWPFTSVQFWGESPAGLWKLHIDHLRIASAKHDELVSKLKNFKIILYGTTKVPGHAKTPKEYHNVTTLPDQDVTYLDNEKNIDINDVQNTVQLARRALAEGANDTEKHLLAIDRLVRQIHKMGARETKDRRFAHIHHTREK